jgi:hypothetical protein
MTLHTLIIFVRGHSYLTQQEIIMNSLILISLTINEVLEALSFTVTYVDCFMLVCIFMLFIFINKNSAISKNNMPEVLV